VLCFQSRSFGVPFALWDAAARLRVADGISGEHAGPSCHGQTKRNGWTLESARGEVLVAGWKHPQASMSANVNRWAVVC